MQGGKQRPQGPVDAPGGIRGLCEHPRTARLGWLLQGCWPLSRACWKTFRKLHGGISCYRYRNAYVQKASCLGIFLSVNMTVVPSEPVWDPNWECTAAEVPGSAVNAGERRSQSPLSVCVGCRTPNVARVEGISLSELSVSECTRDVCFLPCCQHASFNTSVSAVSP